MKNQNSADETQEPKEPRKITLYFKEETMLELTKLKDMLILTGLPSTKLPGMNEILDGIIAYSKYIISQYPGDRERLRNYTQGETSKTTREYEPYKTPEETNPEESDEGDFKKTEGQKPDNRNTRFLYRLMPEEQATLNEIKAITSIDQTNATLIRTLTEFLIPEETDKINLIENIFTGTLFELPPKTSIQILTGPDIKTERIKELNEENKEKIRKITWDHGSFDTLKKAIEKERKLTFTYNTGRYSGGKLLWIFGLKPKTYNSIIEKTISRVNNFNYTLAYSGISLVIGMIVEKITTIPEATIQINKLKNYTAPSFIENITRLMRISDTINNSPEL